MSNFTVSHNPSRYRITATGLTTQRYALPPSSGVGFGEGLLFGLVGGAVLSLPMALRTQASLNHVLMVWLGATGLYGMILGLLSGLLRVARPLPRRSPALPLGLAFAFGPLAALGSILHAHTHHRPLGAATYAVIAGMIVAVSWAAANRVWSSLRSPFPKAPTLRNPTRQYPRARFGRMCVTDARCLGQTHGTVSASLERHHRRLTWNGPHGLRWFCAFSPRSSNRRPGPQDP